MTFCITHDDRAKCIFFLIYYLSYIDYLCPRFHLLLSFFSRMYTIRAECLQKRGKIAIISCAFHDDGPFLLTLASRDAPGVINVAEQIV